MEELGRSDYTMERKVSLIPTEKCDVSESKYMGNVKYKTGDGKKSV